MGRGTKDQDLKNEAARGCYSHDCCQITKQKNCQRRYAGKTKGPPRPRASSVRSHSGTPVGKRQGWRSREPFSSHLPRSCRSGKKFCSCLALTPKRLGMNKSQTPTKTFPKGCPLSLRHEFHLVERQLLRRHLRATRSDAVGMGPTALSFPRSPRDSGVYASLTITVRRDKRRMATEEAIETLQRARE